MNHYTLPHAVVGGILIGFASLIATVLGGEVPGISGVFGRLIVPATLGSYQIRRIFGGISDFSCFPTANLP
jgi:hypothetical protein